MKKHWGDGVEHKVMVSLRLCEHEVNPFWGILNFLASRWLIIPSLCKFRICLPRDNCISSFSDASVGRKRGWFRQSNVVSWSTIFNNYSSSPNGLWINSPFGLGPHGLLTINYPIEVRSIKQWEKEWKRTSQKGNFHLADSCANVCPLTVTIFMLLTMQ